MEEAYIKVTTTTSPTLKQRYQLMDIPVGEIRNSDWDIRRSKEDDSELYDLIQSIRKDGILSPIIVNPIERGENSNNNHHGFEVIAGRRRLRACQKGNIPKIPSFVILDKTLTKADLHRITFAENSHRKELRTLETAYGILKRYQDYGYTGQQVIQGTKSIYTYLQTRKLLDQFHSLDASRLSTSVHELVQNRNVKFKDNFVVDKRFIEICKDIGKNPNYQYQLLQTILQVPEEVMEKAEKEDLSTKKRILLTHSKLRKYPQLQKNLIEKIRDKKIDDSKAKEIVHQTVNDLESGFLRPSESGKTFSYSGDRSKRDVVPSSTKNKIEKDPHDYYMNIHTDITKILYHLTGRQLSRGETKYTKEMVEKTHNHRLEIAKSINSEYRALYGFKDWYLLPVKEAIDDMIQILQDEIESVKKKKGMMEK